MRSAGCRHVRATTHDHLPLLKEVVMLYCDACPTKKMVPRDQLVSAGPCLGGSFADCALYREMAGGGSGRTPRTRSRPP